MELDRKAIEELLEKRPRKKLINEAVSHERKHRFFNDIVLSANDLPWFQQELQNFIGYLKEITDQQKHKVLLSLLRFPLVTNELLQEIYSVLEKIFDGRDGYFVCNFESDNEKQHYIENRDYVKKLKHAIWSCFKSRINSVIVLDAKEGEDEEYGAEKKERSLYPETYFYIVNIDNVVDFELVKGSNAEFEHVLFIDDNKLYAYDRTKIFVYTLEENKIKDTVKEIAHGVPGTCPARFVFNTSINSEKPHLALTTVTNQYSLLDWFIVQYLGYKSLYLTSAFPIYTMISDECDYTNDLLDEYCESGFLKNRATNQYILSGNGLKSCPVCEKKRLVMPGTLIEIPAPREGQPEIKDPLKMVGADVASLQFNSEDIQAVKNEIFINCTGVVAKAVETQQVNEKQVRHSVEDRTQVLRNTKKPFEEVQAWVEKTKCQWTYNTFKSCFENYGTEFYFLNLGEVMDFYNKAKNNGASEIILDYWYNLMIDTQYKNNPVQLSRAKTLSLLEPYRHFSIDKVATYVDRNSNLFIIKLNFSSFIERFEREHTDVVNFVKTGTFDERIKNIQQKLNEYAEETKTGQQPQQTQTTVTAQGV